MEKEELLDLLRNWISVLLERHPQLRGLDDDAKWGGKAIPSKCKCCGANWNILFADLRNIRDSLKQKYIK